MTMIDSQVHAYEANTPKRPWHSVPNWPDHVTGDEMVAAMDKVGVDGAIFISAFSMYRYDASYAVEAQRAHPGRLAIVKPVDPDHPGVADIVADWKKTPGAVGIRIMLTKENKREPDDPGLDRIARATGRFEDLAQTFRDLAAKHHTAFIPMIYKNLINVPDTIQQDGIHPTAKGSNILADTLIPALKPLLHK